jgi:hypothetical protein
MSVWAGIGRADGPAGHTYAGLVVRIGPAVGRAEVLAALRELRFSGWLGPEESGWLVAVPERGAGTVASGRRGVLELAGDLAGRLGATLVAVRVADDRQLVLSLWQEREETGRYVSDPSHGLRDDEVLSDPMGDEHAAAFAVAVGRPEAAEELGELLAEELDPDSVIESERLVRVLRLLGLPEWLVACSSLPRDVPGGPRSGDVTRLGFGVPGLGGRVAGRVAQVARTRRRPPPVVTDPPRGGRAAEPWLW